MVIDIRQIAARDQLPGQKDYIRFLIANATATSFLKDGDPGNVLDADERTRWKSKGIGEQLTLKLPRSAKVCRVDIEWDPDLPRTGSADISIGPEMFRVQPNGSLFTVLEDESSIATADEIVIECYGNKDNDLNGIATVAVYGY